MSAPRRKTKQDPRDRVDRNDDGSLDDIVLCLEPDLMLRAEEMDDGQWWVAIYAGKEPTRDLRIDLMRRRKEWTGYVEDEGLLRAPSTGDGRK